MGIDDISCFGWNHQKNKMNDPQRKIFHLEHVTPVSQIFKELKALNTTSSKDIIGVIAKMELAWILKSEDKMLSEKRFKMMCVEKTV